MDANNANCESEDAKTACAFLEERFGICDGETYSRTTSIIILFEIRGRGYFT
jgi:hypothetical protein